MRRPLRRAAVLGAGTMGAAIAAHLANAGVPTLLLDIVPPELTDDERRRGLTRDHPEVRTRLARQGLDRALRAQPAAFFSPDRAALVTVGNLEDDLGKIREADWVIEAVVEHLETKQALMARVEAEAGPDAVVSTNTSGLPVGRIAEGRSEAFRRRFLGTHFFNPPRYLKLLEVIPTADTDPAVADLASEWGERVLGKGVVRAKDTPNFIGNRIGMYGLMKTIRLMLDEGLRIEEVDELTGPAIGRPRTATFRLTDLVGLDVALQVAENSYRHLPDDEEREIFRAPDLLREMAARGWLGEKTGGGFFKRVDGEILALDPETMEYRPRKKVMFPAVEAAKAAADPGKRLRTLFASPDKAGAFLWKLFSSVLAYAANRVAEIAGDVVNVDRAMRWGFAWDLGPFETWDAVGVREIADRLRAEGRAVPAIVRAVLERGDGAFYRIRDGRREHFDPATGEYLPVPARPEAVVLADLAPTRTVARNPGASVLDLGDGVACLEFHTKLNIVGEDTIRMIFQALEIVRRDFDALVIGNQGSDFSAGANLVQVILEAQEGNWEDLDFGIRQFQAAAQAIRRFEKPVVAAPFGRTLGGGTEFTMASARAQASAETYVGLVETAVGLIPAGTGTMEMARRVSARVPEGVEADLLPFVRFAFENIALARVSTSAEDARRLGYLRECDGVSMHPDHLIHDARAVSLHLVRTGYRPPLRRPIRVIGERGFAAIEAGLFLMKTAGYASEYDIHVGRKLAYVLCGGLVPERSEVSEEYLLDLEREAFLSLLGEARTQDRIRHTLQTGRPLRN